MTCAYNRSIFIFRVCSSSFPLPLLGICFLLQEGTLGGTTFCQLQFLVDKLRFPLRVFDLVEPSSLIRQYCTHPRSPRPRSRWSSYTYSHHFMVCWRGEWPCRRRDNIPCHPCHSDHPSVGTSWQATPFALVPQ